MTLRRNTSNISLQPKYNAAILKTNSILNLVTLNYIQHGLTFILLALHSLYTPIWQPAISLSVPPPT